MKLRIPWNIPQNRLTEAIIDTIKIDLGDELAPVGQEATTKTKDIENIHVTSLDS